jgi:hypothetical protein
MVAVVYSKKEACVDKNDKPFNLQKRHLYIFGIRIPLLRLITFD